jgi:ubiquinone/menaquinone biosynthesis C-methylase UbiE
MYSYPDVNDRIVSRLISKESCKTYWKRSEENVLSIARRVFERGKYKSMLDLGAGTGRLSAKFSECFKEITVLEPDKQRLLKARKALGKKKARFIQSQFLDSRLPKNRFDVVICSHMIQHIKTRDVTPTINKIHDILKGDGILVVMTNYSKKGTDFFTKMSMKGNDVEEVKISKTEYNKLVKNTNTILPVHYFSVNSLKKYLKGFSIVSSKVFHLGRDIFIMAKKN